MQTCFLSNFINVLSFRITFLKNFLIKEKITTPTQILEVFRYVFDLFMQVCYDKQPKLSFFITPQKII